MLKESLIRMEFYKDGRITVCYSSSITKSKKKKSLKGIPKKKQLLEDKNISENSKMKFRRDSRRMYMNFRRNYWRNLSLRREISKEVYENYRKEKYSLRNPGRNSKRNVGRNFQRISGRCFQRNL